MNEGLAAIGAQVSKQEEMTVDQVVALLKQGVQPEELVQMGVPPAVIEQAVQVLTQTVTAVPNEGLAGMTTQGGNI